MSDTTRCTTEAPGTDPRFDVPLRGIEVGPNTRCGHWDSTADVIAIRFPCCEVFYPCVQCHRTVAEHEPTRWSTDQFDVPAVLCGRCRTVLSVAEYLDADHHCPACEADFNPGCVRHHDEYFDFSGASD